MVEMHSLMIRKTVQATAQQFYTSSPLSVDGGRGGRDASLWEEGKEMRNQDNSMAFCRCCFPSLCSLAFKERTTFPGVCPAFAPLHLPTTKKKRWEFNHPKLQQEQRDPQVHHRHRNGSQEKKWMLFPPLMLEWIHLRSL